MENLNNIAKLLGEENEKRLKDSITDMIINRIQEELDDFYEYTIDYDGILDEVGREIKAAVKEKYMKIYMAKMDAKFAELFEKQFGD